MYGIWDYSELLKLFCSDRQYVRLNQNLALGQDEDSELQKVFNSDIKNGHYGSHLEA